MREFESIDEILIEYLDTTETDVANNLIKKMAIAKLTSDTMDERIIPVSAVVTAIISRSNSGSI